MGIYTNMATSGQLGNGTTAHGMSALKKQIASTIGKDNTAYGNEALENLEPGKNESTAVGSQALSNSLTGENSAFGAYAAEKCANGDGNTALGSWCLRNVDGIGNTASGHRAMAGDGNIESKSPPSVATGRYNTAYGFGAYRASPDGEYNTACGYNAMTNATGMYANENTACGSMALSKLDGKNVSSGSISAFGNSAFGKGAGLDITTGSHNTFIGYNSKSMHNDGKYRTAIGAGSVAGVNNSIILGRSNGIPSEEDYVGIGTAEPKSKLHVVSNNGIAVNIEGGLRVKVQVINANGTHTIDSDAYMIYVGNSVSDCTILLPYITFDDDGRVYAIHNNSTGIVNINTSGAILVMGGTAATNTKSLARYTGVTLICVEGKYCTTSYNPPT